jgi:hypothetical protein
VIKERDEVIKERDKLITERNKAIKTSAVLLWMIEARDDEDANDADNKQTVPSSTTAQTSYVIAYDNIKECYTCSCPDYMYRRASKDELCKHITKLKSTGRLPAVVAQPAAQSSILLPPAPLAPPLSPWEVMIPKGIIRDTVANREQTGFPTMTLESRIDELPNVNIEYFLPGDIAGHFAIIGATERRKVTIIVESHHRRRDKLVEGKYIFTLKKCRRRTHHGIAAGPYSTCRIGLTIVKSSLFLLTTAIYNSYKLPILPVK